MPSQERLFDFVATDPCGISHKAGVYAVCVRKDYKSESTERIIYIGSAINIERRVMKHSHVYRLYLNRYPQAVVYTKEIETEDYIQLERKLIAVYRPLLNKQNKK